MFGTVAAIVGTFALLLILASLIANVREDKRLRRLAYRLRRERGRR